MSLFAAYLAKSGLQASFISYLSALQYLQISAGLPSPGRDEWLQLQYILRGIKCSKGRIARRPTRLPITLDLLQKIQYVLAASHSSLDEFGKTTLWAACCTGFLGFMQLGEFTCSRANQGATICHSDVAIDSHANLSVVRIFLARAKIDPFGHGVHIYLGRTNTAVCPVTAILRFLAIRPVRDDSLFIWSNGSPLTQQQFVRAVRTILGEANVDQTAYSGHSFRIGTATSAARAGIPSHVIKMLGRWDPRLCYRAYCCVSPAKVDMDTMAKWVDLRSIYISSLRLIYFM